jgi:hypothetical protein
MQDFRWETFNCMKYILESCCMGASQVADPNRTQYLSEEFQYCKYLFATVVEYRHSVCRNWKVLPPFLWTKKIKSKVLQLAVIASLWGSTCRHSVCRNWKVLQGVPKKTKMMWNIPSFLTFDENILPYTSIYTRL